MKHSIFLWAASPTTLLKAFPANFQNTEPLWGRLLLALQRAYFPWFPLAQYLSKLHSHPVSHSCAPQGSRDLSLGCGREQGFFGVTSALGVIAVPYIYYSCTLENFLYLSLAKPHYSKPINSIKFSLFKLLCSFFWLYSGLQRKHILKQCLKVAFKSIWQNSFEKNSTIVTPPLAMYESLDYKSVAPLFNSSNLWWAYVLKCVFWWAEVFTYHEI